MIDPVKAIEVAVKSVDGVLFVHVEVNYSYYRDIERAMPPASIRVSVRGGKRKEVAKAILLVKPCGFATAGNTSKKVKFGGLKYQVFFETV